MFMCSAQIKYYYPGHTCTHTNMSDSTDHPGYMPCTIRQGLSKKLSVKEGKVQVHPVRKVESMYSNHGQKLQCIKYCLQMHFEKPNYQYNNNQSVVNENKNLELKANQQIGTGICSILDIRRKD